VDNRNSRPPDSVRWQIKDEPANVNVDIGVRAGQDHKLLPTGSQKRTTEEAVITFPDDSDDELKPVVKAANTRSKVCLRLLCL
jgi:hypothetical protein